MSTSILDITGGVSSCCGALMYIDQGICKDCGEHCLNEEEKPERTFSADQEIIIAEHMKNTMCENCESTDPSERACFYCKMD